MRVRVTPLFLAILFIPALAFADFHKVDFSGGGSGGTGGSSVFGFQQSLSWGVRKCPSCGIVLPDISVQFGTHEDPVTHVKTDETQVAYQFGFRWTPTSLYGRNKDRHEDTPTKVFIQLLAGQAYTNDGTAATGKNGVITLGAGIQRFLRKEDRTKNGRSEPHCAGLGFQAEVDHIWRNDREGFWRVSGGVVYRFLHPNER